MSAARTVVFVLLLLLCAFVCATVVLNATGALAWSAAWIWLFIPLWLVGFFGSQFVWITRPRS